MIFLVAMPRETDTSLFTSRVTQGLFLFVCLIGLVLNCLVYYQNFRHWSERRQVISASDDEKKLALKSNRHDLINSSLICGMILVLLLFLIFKFSVSLLTT